MFFNFRYSTLTASRKQALKQEIRKEEIKKELEDSIINSERHENKASEVKKTEDAAAVIREFEEIIESKKKTLSC